MADASAAEAKSALRENVSIETTVYLDTVASYRGLEVELVAHETSSRREGEYVRSRATINAIEAFWTYPEEHLLHHHGVAHDHFLLSLKEVEYRYY